ncbi:MAG: efflux RND transporter permease subunit, partial [Proteobacteria bacterium]|nr:efflux RND transporter permease subunit [Pseudomonadota bacterium]
MKGSFSKFFLFDKTFAIVLALTFIIGGLVAYETMIRENYPDLAIPQAIIYSEWPGASAEQVEKEITKSLEDKIRALPMLKEYSSSSQNSASIVAVEFEAEADLKTAMQLLRAEVDEAEAEFPRSAEKPEIEQVSVNDLPILTMALYGPLPEYDLNIEADRIKRALEQVEGVRKVNLQGAHKDVIHIRLDPQSLRSL